MKTSGNTILITGGTSGIGLGFAEEFLKRDNKVIICGRRKNRLELIKEKHENIITKVCDVGISSQREELAAWVINNYPGTNILVNNAGIQLPGDLGNEVDMERVTREVDINLIAPIHLTSLFIEHLKAKSESAVINISSGLAFVPLAAVPVYCATKAALHSVTMSLRHQLRNTSVKVFEIIPPSVDTELGSERRADKSQSHGGIPVIEFVEESMRALESNLSEAAIAGAKGLREKGDSFFHIMNG